MDALFEAHISDMQHRCMRDYSPVYSAFLDEAECVLAENFCRRTCGELMYCFWGGFEEAKRKILCIYPDYSQDSVIEDCPVRCLTFTFRKEDKLSHRDFLGSFMALQLKRNVIGDIIIDDGIAQALVTDVAARLIISSVSKIGRVGVKISDSEPFKVEVKQEFETIGGTVASLRLDCIVSMAAKISREKASSLIRSEKVTVNHFPVSSASYELKQGDIISVRGSGKFIFESTNGITKKGRTHVVLLKFK